MIAQRVVEILHVREMLRGVRIIHLNVVLGHQNVVDGVLPERGH